MSAAGMEILFEAAMEGQIAIRKKDLVGNTDLLAAMQVVWWHLRKSVLNFTPVHTRTSRLERGDVCGFLVAVRDFLQKRTVATRATIRGKISSLSIADFRPTHIH